MSRDCVRAEHRPTSTHTAARRGRETTPTSSGDVPSFDTLPVLPAPIGMRREVYVTARFAMVRAARGPAQGSAAGRLK
jgi:hypothetical protein